MSSTAQYMTPDEWDIGPRDSVGDDENCVAVNAQLIRDRLFENVHVMAKCNSKSEISKCNLGKEYYNLKGGSDAATSIGSFVAANDGTGYIILVSTQPGCGQSRGKGQYLGNVCGLIFADINGSKKPNTFGKDTFLFYLTKNGIVPCGLKEESAYPFDKSNTGHEATAWVIYKENLDYLRCKDKLSWDGKSSCK